MVQEIGIDIFPGGHALIVITPTGNRPEQIRLCAEYLQRQTVQPDRWLVVDDGRYPLEDLPGAEIIRREPGPEDPPHTLVLNMLQAMAVIQDDSEVCVMMEDDDWYSPIYLERMAEWMKRADVAGEAGTHYYHFPFSKKIVHKHIGHASLFKTAFRPRYFKTIKIPDDWRLDLALWRTGEGQRRIMETSCPLAIGMKGLPGRQGTSSGWDTSRPEWVEDPGRRWLRGMIGAEDLERMEGIWG